MPKKVLLLGTGIALLISFLYQPTLRAFFVSDDFYLWRTVKNLSFWESLRLFLPPVLGGISVVAHTGHQAPLSGWVFWLLTVPLAMKPLAAHSLSLLLDLFNTFLVSILNYRLTRNTKISLLSALIFGTIPFISEAVNYTSAILFLLVTGFYISALISIHHYLITPKKIWLLMHFVCFYLSLLSAEIAITLPLATLALLVTAKKKNPLVLLSTHKKLFLGHIIIISVYSIFWILTLGTINIFNSSGRFELTTISRIFLYYLIIVGGLLFIRLRFAQIIPNQLKRAEWPFWLFVSLITISWLPMAKFFTQQRYLYLPASFAAMAVGYIFLVVKLNLNNWGRRLLIATLGLTLSIDSLLLYQNSLIWLTAGNTAYQLVKQVAHQLNANAVTPVYLINLPDSINGAYVYRSYFSEALEFYRGKPTPQFIFTPPTIGVNIQTNITGPREMRLTSRDGFMLFKPTYNTHGQRVIEWPTKYHATEINPQQLDVKFVDSTFSWQTSAIYIFENGKIIKPEFKDLR